MDKRKIAKAERLARAIASDISIYNQANIQEGLENDTLFEKIEKDLEEGRALFKTKVSEEIFENTNIFEVAFNDTIVAAREGVKTKIF